MRRVVLATETTGLDVESGHRIIEVACIELDHRTQTGKTFHCYLNPEREIEEKAFEFHGITTEFLQNKPRFSDIADELFKFLKSAELVIYNTEFDIKFLKHEFQLFEKDFYVCTVKDIRQYSLANRLGREHSLNAIASDYSLDLSKMEKQGAMAKAELLVNIDVAIPVPDVRRIVLDTETTGLDVESGNRIIEVACIELDHRTRTGKTFHCYLNPEREIEEKALEVHGITTKFLQDKPRFSDIADELFKFLKEKDAELVIHNAEFDLKFLNHEFQLIVAKTLEKHGITTKFLQDKPRFSDIADEVFEFLKGAELVIHTAEFDLKFLNHEFQLIKKGFSVLEDMCKVKDIRQYSLENRLGREHSLNAIASDYSLDLSKREKQGAMAKAELLVDVYAAMFGGQSSFDFDAEEKGKNGDGVPAPALWNGRDVRRIVLAIETTGLDVESGNRIIEVACIELDHHDTPTGNTYHSYLNPFPALKNVCLDTLQYSRKIRPGGSHSLDALANRYRVDMSKRKKREGGHGAMLDAELLVDVYAAMFGGQSSFDFDAEEKGKNGDGVTAPAQWNGKDVVVLAATEEERHAHEKYLDYLDRLSPSGSIWRQNEASQKPDSNQ